MAGAVAQYRVDVGTFDGTGGSMRARQFIRIVDQAIASSGITVQRMAAIVQAALKGAAALWLETRQSLGTAGLDSWATIVMQEGSPQHCFSVSSLGYSP